MSKLFIIISSIILIIACNNQTEKKEVKEVPIAAIIKHIDSNEIVLNNGEKWKVDDKMLVHIRNMENDINSFENTSNTDYKELAKNLQSNLDLLTSNCTMKGQAHDELHKWLLPYIDMVNEFSETKNKQELQEQFKKIQSSFLTFNQYFQ
jgi:hypothetical protein